MLKKNTFILVEQDFDQRINLPNEVSNYLSKLKNEFAFTVNSLSGEIAKSAQNDSKLNARYEISDENNQKNFLDVDIDIPDSSCCGTQDRYR